MLKFSDLLIVLAFCDHNGLILMHKLMFYMLLNRMNLNYNLKKPQNKSKNSINAVFWALNICLLLVHLKGIINF